MSDRKESISDIVEEMRAYKGIPVPLAPERGVWLSDFHALADRIEAAAIRLAQGCADAVEDAREAAKTGNVARLRAALEVCEKAMCDYCLEAAGKNPQLAGKPCLNGCETLRLAKAALEETAAAEKGGAK